MSLQGHAGLQTVLPLCVYVFFGIMYREVLMDMNDAEGDRAASVWTLPVVHGMTIPVAVTFVYHAPNACRAWCKHVARLSRALQSIDC